jgi:hypothetical protein
MEDKKFYKMKHIPTGLYFQPHKHRGSHLSKSGKIYQTNSNGIETGNYGHKFLTICCENGSLIHRVTSDKLAWEKGYSYNQLKVNTLFTDWVREYI